METRIPDIPGQLLEDPDTRRFLNGHIAQLCGLSNDRFPGSQPVSFTSRSLDDLEKMDFWVCEKSDGVRILLFIVMNGMSGNQEVWIIDRKQRYFQIGDLHFTHWERMDQALTDTILDGELVIDIDPNTGAEVLRFYVFDCLVLNGENIMQKPLVKRFARLREWVIAPMKRSFQRFPEWKDKMPFEILPKKQELSYHISQVLNVHIPQLQHGHDGLIFTCAESAYYPGTDEKILKWKPPSENSIDFRIELRFPPSSSNPSEPDWYAKPVFLLNQWCGRESYEFFDEMEVDDDQWEKMKESGEQYDGRIVEVCWDADRNAWQYFRFRDDKPHGNHRSIVTKILQSIEDGVEIEEVLARQDEVRHCWKSREMRRGSGGGGGSGSSSSGRPPQQPHTQQQRRPPSSHQQGGHPIPPKPAPAPPVAGLRR